MQCFKEYLYSPTGPGQRVSIPTTGSNAVTWTSDAPAGLVQAFGDDLLFTLDGTAPTAPNGFRLVKQELEVWSAVRIKAARFVSAGAAASVQVTPIS